MGSGALQYSRKNIQANWGLTQTQAPLAPWAFEDFIAAQGATLADTYSVLITQTGTASQAAIRSATAGGAAGQAGHGGWLLGSVDNVDAEIDLVALGGVPWLVPTALTTGGVIIGEIGFVVPTALTARQYFFGLSDAATESTATNGPLNIDGTTNVVAVADDAAGFIMSSLATDADGWYTANAIATTAVADATNSGLTAIVDRYTKLRVEIDVSGNAYFYGKVHSATTGGRAMQIGYVGQKASAVTASDPYCPIFSAAPTTTTAVEWEIDYILGGVSLT